jgi:hypothetical protein
MPSRRERVLRDNACKKPALKNGKPALKRRKLNFTSANWYAVAAQSLSLAPKPRALAQKLDAPLAPD